MKVGGFDGVRAGHAGQERVSRGRASVREVPPVPAIYVHTVELPALLAPGSNYNSWDRAGFRSVPVSSPGEYRAWEIARRPPPDFYLGAVLDRTA